MADFKGVNSTRAGQANALIPPGLWNGSVRVHFDSYTTAGTEAAADRIFVGRLEPNAVFLAADISFGAMGSGATFALGDAGSANRYMAATSVAAAGTARALAGMGYRNATKAPIDLFLTVAGATLAATQAVKVAIYSTTD